jgi:hypothetical protein
VGGDDQLPIAATLQLTVPSGGACLHVLLLCVGQRGKIAAVGMPCHVMIAGAAGPAPLVIFSAGFLLNSNLYRSYAELMASYGYAGRPNCCRSCAQHGQHSNSTLHQSLHL